MVSIQGIIKPKENVDVIRLFKDKLDKIYVDLEGLSEAEKKTSTRTYLGDARKMTDCLERNSVNLMITSPPYPGDHEYTKHSKLELIFLDFAMSMEQFRTIKQRMLRGSTTNIYKQDVEGESIKSIKSIKDVTDEIDARLKADGGTSGFEKLYSKLVREYFGGMYKAFEEALKILKPGAKFALLVSDSHAFKMVHIETANILAEVALSAGFTNAHVELWQEKKSTSHKYKLLENILTLQKSKQNRK